MRSKADQKEKKELPPMEEDPDETREAQPHAEAVLLSCFDPISIALILIDKMPERVYQ